MTEDTTVPSGAELSRELTQIATQLRALSSNGLQWAEDPYQVERYHEILRLAARLLSLVDGRPSAQIAHQFFADIGLRAPFGVVDTALLDAAGRILLIQRADDKLWALPGGACDVGEAAATAAAREVWEETGYRAEITQLLGVFDSRHCGTRTSQHLYHLLFTGQVIDGEATTSRETIDVCWFAPDAVPWDALSPGHPRRIRFALTWRADPAPAPFFDWEDWQPDGA